MIDQRAVTNAIRGISGAKYRRQSEGPQVVRRQGVIAATHVGPPKTVDLTLGGSAVVLTDIRYLNGYTPTVADVVEVRVIGTDLLVLGELA